MLPALKLFDPTMTPMQKAAAHIRRGWIAALISCGVTNIAAYTGWMGFDAWNFLDAELLLGMAWGVQRKSRVASTSLMIYFIGGKILLLLEDPALFRPNMVTLGFCTLYILAMIGTYRWHRLQHAPTEAAPGP